VAYACRLIHENQTHRRIQFTGKNMETEPVTQKILADARVEADKITKEAEDKEAAEQAKLANQVKEYKKQTETLADKAGKDEKAHILAAARMEIAGELLAEKRKILDEVFSRARQQLQNLPDDQYRKLITKLMLDAVQTGDEEVIVDSKESRIDQQLISLVNERLGSSKKGNLKLSQEKWDIEGGFVLRRGRIKTNVSFGVLLDRARSELEIELAKELFAVRHPGNSEYGVKEQKKSRSSGSQEGILLCC
jgi:V/A-type H+-transporting ATPase subunit E